MDNYDPQAIERKWQQVWEEAAAFVTPNPGPDDPPSPDARSAYVLEMSEGKRDVYFSVRSFAGYGKLSRRKIDDLLA